MDEAKYKRNEAENEKLLKEFEQCLRSKGLSDKTINNHMNHVAFYLNVYLNDHNYASAKEGIEYNYLADFLDYFFIRKCFPSTPGSLRSMASSIKKFYTFMYENKLIEKKEYNDFKFYMKESIDTWCEDCKNHNEGISVY